MFQINPSTTKCGSLEDTGTAAIIARTMNTTIELLAKCQASGLYLVNGRNLTYSQLIDLHHHLGLSLENIDFSNAVSYSTLSIRALHAAARIRNAAENIISDSNRKVLQQSSSSF